MIGVYAYSPESTVLLFGWIIPMFGDVNSTAADMKIIQGFRNWVARTFVRFSRVVHGIIM